MEASEPIGIGSKSISWPLEYFKQIENLKTEWSAAQQRSFVEQCKKGLVSSPELHYDDPLLWQQWCSAVAKVNSLDDFAKLSRPCVIIAAKSEG